MEIALPVDKQLRIDALQSGADVWVADMDDSFAPSWRNVVEAQLNLADVLERPIDFTTAEDKGLPLPPAMALPTVVVRPRGLHLAEAHVLVDGEAIAGSIMDFGLYFYHNARHLLAQGQGLHFSLPKIESHLEARFWNNIFILAQDFLGIPRGSIRAMVLIKTVTAAFEMEEILYELRDHISGIGTGPCKWIQELVDEEFARLEYFDGNRLEDVRRIRGSRPGTRLPQLPNSLHSLQRHLTEDSLNETSREVSAV